jgi:hypothetical protein
MRDAKPARIFYQLVKIGHKLATIGQPRRRFSEHGMLKIGKNVTGRRCAKTLRNSLIQKTKMAICWYISTVARPQQHSTKQLHSFSVHILATAPKLSPARRKRA